MKSGINADYDYAAFLQNNAGRFERDFDLSRGSGLPTGERFYVGFGDGVPIAIAEQRFQEYSDRIGQGRDVAEAGVLEFREAIDADLAGARFECVAGFKGVRF